MTPGRSPLVLEATCIACDALGRVEPGCYRCVQCGSPLRLPPFPVDAGKLDTSASGPHRYREWLGIVEPLALGEPTTPITQITIAGHAVLVKLEGALPTGSFKDRGAQVLVAWLRHHGVAQCADDSSGNAGAALAAYCARAGIACELFVPENASPAKLVQARAFGAVLRVIPGPRSSATQAVEQAAAKGATVYASHQWHAIYQVGTQTFAFELWEQLGRRAPQMVVVPVGGGALLLGIHRGFTALLAAGLIDVMPRLVGVQSTACAPLVYGTVSGFSSRGLADGIMVAHPVWAADIRRVVAETGGELLAVDDHEVLTAFGELACVGVLVEPTSAVTIAAVLRLAEAGVLPTNGDVVVAATGHGLKGASRLETLIASS